MSRKPLRALIIEDSEDDAILLVRELGKQGFELSWERACTAPAMKSLLAAGSWDVVLSDYSMPGFDALAALQLLHQTGLDLPFIVISGTVGEEIAVAAMKNGAHDYLPKGRLKRLGAAVERELKEAGVRREHRLAIDEIEHLNRMLRAIRDVNKLIVTEKDRGRLLARAAELLVDTRGYTSAWCVQIDGDQQPAAVACSVADAEPALAPAAARLDAGLTPCMRAALRAEGSVITEHEGPGCGDCQLHEALAGRQCLAVALSHDHRVFGVLCVALRKRERASAREIDLLAEMAGDLGFALYGMDRAEALAASQRDFYSVVESMADGLAVYDRDGRITFMNRMACAWLGYELDELVGRPIEELFAADSRRVFASQQPIRSTGRSSAFEIDLLTKQGVNIPTIASGSDLVDANRNITGGVALFTNLVERKAAELVKRQYHNRLQLVIDSSRLGLWDLDLTTRRVVYDGHWERFLGGPIEPPTYGQWRSLVHPDDIGPLDASNLAQIEGQTRGSPMQEFRMRHRDGHWVWLAGTGKVVERAGDGRALRMTGTAAEITEIKNLQHQVAQSDRLATMGMLAAGVAHEINNPLSYLLYNLESLAEDLPQLLSALGERLAVVAEGPDNAAWAGLLGETRELLNPATLDDIRERLKDALLGSHRIRDVARGLGAFSRVEKDRMVPVDLTEVIEVASSMATNEIKYRARPVKDYGRTATVLANDGRLSQVFLNLLINAAHAITEGDVAHNEIRVRTWQEGDEVFAEVRDTGKGISAEQLPYVFEPFFTTKAVGDGTGLGLAISKSIVEEYGGRIEVESEVGKGTRFVVRLPVKKADAPDVEVQREQALSRPQARHRILVVDDEAAIRGLLVRLLRGHDVVQAVSGEAAREILKADQAFDLIVCDVMMPILSGVELHQWLSTTHPELTGRFVFITGGAFTPNARAYLSTVSHTHIEKPFDAAQFKQLVGEQLARSPPPPPPRH